MKIFKIPDIPVKRIERNVFHEKLLQETETSVSKYANKQWKDNEDWVELLSIAYSNVTDYEKVLLVSKWTMAGFMLDDQLDFSPQIMSQYIDFFLEKKFESTLNEDKLSIEYSLFKDVYTNLKQLTSPGFFKLIIKESINFVKAVEMGMEMKKHSSSETAEHLLEVRKYDAACYLYVVFTMFIFDANESIVDIDDVKEFNDKCCTHLILVNDLYSFKKDVLKNTIQFNYVNILSIEKGLSLEETVDLVVIQVLEIEMNMYSLKDRIIENYPEVPVNYLVGMIDLCLGCLVWSKFCKRYNNLN